MKEFGSINVVDQGELSEGATPPGYTQLLYHNQLDSIIAVTVDHNIIIYGLPELETKKQVSHLSENVVLVRSIDLKFYDLLCVLLECFMNYEFYEFHGASCNLYVLRICVYHSED